MHPVKLLLPLLPVLLSVLRADQEAVPQRAGVTAVRTESAGEPPDENRFTRTVLAADLREPMELAVTTKGEVYWVERYGSIQRYDPATGRAAPVARLNVFAGNNDGLLGLALDPGFEANGHLYLYYSPAGATPQQHVSRFTLREGKLDILTEKVLLRIPTQREECCHSAGSLAFGPGGNLYIAVGDNTNPSQQEGYAPVDERPGRAAFDAQRTSANTNDLRGKILRIHPEPDGTYTVPDGNLFPRDGSRGKPEIYVMGARNPFRISVDARTGYLYFGDIGPDANSPGPKGPAAYDEFNVARRPGNYGWPYFVGDNKPYPKVDFSTGAAGPYPNPEAPENHSPNNTGSKTLPPVQKPFLWYTYFESETFPGLGTGGRSALAGPVYRYNPGLASETKFPAYYDGFLFLFEWMRDWVKVVRLDADGNMTGIEPFMPATEFSSPVDMAFGPDGSLYVLEYGAGWYSNNRDARLSHITYNPGNRPPVAKASASVTAGKAPLTVQFSSKGTLDHDGDPLKYRWQFGAEGVSNEPNPAFAFVKNGVYPCRLTVTDAGGKKAEAVVEVIVGNTPPQVSLDGAGNRTFFWDGYPVPYQVRVEDAEDGSLARGGIKPASVRVFLAYATGGDNLSPVLTAQAREVAHPGKLLIDGSDCKSCHQTDGPSVGPSYRQVAQKYKDQPHAVDRLTEKVIRGGGGVWTQKFTMVAHPQLSPKAAAQMVNYILSLDREGQKPQRMGVQGRIQPVRPDAKLTTGFYRLTAAYQDKGGPGVKPLRDSAVLVLKYPLVQAESYDVAHRVKTFGEIEDGDGRYVGNIRHGSHAVYRGIDLTDVGGITYGYATTTPGVTLEVRLDSTRGEMVSAVEVPPKAGTADWQKLNAPLNAVRGTHDLYLIFECKKTDAQDIIRLDWLFFERRPDGKRSE
jgi:cytochrome c